MNRRECFWGLAAAAAVIQGGTLNSKIPGQSLELEVIVSSAEDALAAYAGGATRLAIEVKLNQGGLTPPLQMVENILDKVPLLARVMLRLDPEFQTDFVMRGRRQLEELKSHAQALSRLKIDGLLTGYSRNGVLDLETLQEIIDAAPATRYTIHNVIEFTRDPLEALRSLRDFEQVDRAMVTCGSGSLADRMRRIPSYEAALGQNRRIVLGSLEIEMLSTLRRHTDIRTFHLGSSVRTPQTAFGKVDAEKVKKAHQILFP